MIPYALGTLVLVTLVYYIDASYYYQLYQENPSLTWIIPIPAIEMVRYFSPQAVSLMGVTYYFIFLVMAYFVGEALKRRPKEIFGYLAWMVLGVFLLVSMAAIAVIYPNAQTLVADYREHVNAGIQQFLEMQKQSGMSLERLLEFESIAKDWVQYSFFLLPFIFFSYLVFVVVLNVVIAKRFFRMHFKFLFEIELSQFQVPFIFVWPVIAVISVMLINEKFWDNDPLFFMLLNVLMASGVVYFLQGLAVFVHYLNSKNIFGMWRLLFYLFMLIMWQTTIFVFAGLGFFENWLNVRQLGVVSAPPVSKKDQNL